MRTIARGTKVRTVLLVITEALNINKQPLTADSFIQLLYISTMNIPGLLGTIPLVDVFGK